MQGAVALLIHTLMIVLTRFGCSKCAWLFARYGGSTMGDFTTTVESDCKELVAQ
jgi:hypothetical protein